MDAYGLIRELGHNLGAPLELSPAGTCRAVFDADVVDFEKAEDDLVIMADLGSAENRDDAHAFMLAGNHLGKQTGGAVLGIDEERAMFVLHMELWAGMPYESFESKLILFIKAVRWWKEWLALDPAKADAPQDFSSMPFMGGMLRI